MALTLYFNPDHGRQRLLEQPNDVIPREPSRRARRYEDANDEHRTLFREYRDDLRRAYAIAEPWWEGTIEAQQELGKSRDDAVRDAYHKRVAGAASHPIVIWIVRTFWLACCDVNEEVPPGDHVYPETLLLQWLIDAEETDLVQLVTCMPYWPVGLDAGGNWC